MGGQRRNLAAEALEDELDILGWQTLHAFLDHIVSKLVTDTYQHFATELLGHFQPLVLFSYIKNLNKTENQ